MHHTLVDLHIQQIVEGLALLLAAPPQELVELPLRKDDRLGEGVEIQPDDALHSPADLRGAAGDRVPLFLLPCFETRRGGGPVHRAAYPVFVSPGPEAQRYGHAGRALADQVFAGFVQPRGLAIEGIRHGIQQRSLSGAGLPRDREQIEAAEVDFGPFAE